MLEGIKSKLGFADSNKRDYDDYDDYDDYGAGYDDYDADYEDDADASRYDPYSTVTTRPALSGRSGARSSRGSYGGAHAAARSESSLPKLVSIDDVRAHTQLPDSLNRDPLPPRRVTPAATGGSFRGGRTVVDATMPAPSSPAHVAAEAKREARRSEGLESLFDSTASEAKAASAPATAATPSFDPFDAYAGAGTATHAPSRSLTVFKPASYAEVERVAKTLKAGDVVVLTLRDTPSELAKRVLDFSFGVSSALDASVDCVSDKVFAITRGAGLTDAERTALRNQGVL